MLLSFPNGEYREVSLSQRSVTIGSSNNDDVTVRHPSVAPNHACLLIDNRGIVLAVGRQQATVLNGRPIHRQAFVRPGDELRLGEVELVLRGAARESRQGEGKRNSAPGSSADSFRVRGLQGAVAGRAIPLGPIDALPELRFGHSHGQPWVESGTDRPVLVNGHPVKSAVLKSGDQVVLGDQRLLLEAASFVPGGDHFEGTSGSTQGVAGQSKQRRWELAWVGGLVLLAMGFAGYLLLQRF